jgi:hypothetical protein
MTVTTLRSGVYHLLHTGLNNDGNYIEVWCVPSATHRPCAYRGHIKALGISVLCKASERVEINLIKTGNVRVT